MRRAVASVMLVIALGSGCKDGARSSLDGKVLFESTCAQCHGVDGRAVATWKARLGVPDLADAKVQASLSDEQMTAIIKNGKNGRMPPWGGVFSDVQIEQLVKYVRTLKQ